MVDESTASPPPSIEWLFLEVGRRYCFDDRAPETQRQFLALVMQLSDRCRLEVERARGQHVAECWRSMPRRDPDLVCRACGSGSIAALESATAVLVFHVLHAPSLLWAWLSYVARKASRLGARWAGR